jgi:hypothetical protein
MLTSVEAEARRARETMHPLAAWTSLREKIKTDGIDVTEEMREMGTQGNALLVEATFRFGNLPATAETVQRISDVLRAMDKQFGGCQRVNLALPPPGGTNLPRGVFSDSSVAVYKFNLIRSENPETSPASP